jgi:topoisomerase-4 subunit A
MKLKEGDEVINVAITKPNTILITKTGYYLNYTTSEIPVSGAKTSGVKGINLKDDYVVAGFTYNSDDEYIDIFTNQFHNIFSRH